MLSTGGRIDDVHILFGRVRFVVVFAGSHVSSWGWLADENYRGAIYTAQAAGA